MNVDDNQLFEYQCQTPSNWWYKMIFIKENEPPTQQQPQQQQQHDGYYHPFLLSLDNDLSDGLDGKEKEKYFIINILYQIKEEN